MTPHRWCTAAFLVLLAGMLLLHRSQHVPLWSYGLLTATYISIVALGSARIDSGYHLKALCHGARDRNAVLLSFDDGPDPDVTPRVLDMLKEADIKALFFPIGKKAEANPAIVERIHREGHCIGNHSWGHGHFFDLYSATRVTEELERANGLLERITGEKPRCFRPPYGVSNPMIRKAVKRTGLRVIGWDVRSYDTSVPPEKAVQRVLKRSRPGSIVLLHDSHGDLVGILSQLLPSLREKGFSFSDPRDLLQN